MKRPLYYPGTLTLIYGPMFSGKTGKLIASAKILKNLKREFIIFKPALDDRYSKSASLHSHDHKMLKAELVDTNSLDIITERIIEQSPDTVLIDEIQFFDKMKILKLVQDCLRLGINVIAAGLLEDYRLQPFGVVPILLKMADESWPLYSVCQKCGAKAAHSERVSGGDKTIDVGASDKYIAACTKCHKIYQDH